MSQVFTGKQKEPEEPTAWKEKNHVGGIPDIPQDRATVLETVGVTKE